MNNFIIWRFKKMFDKKKTIGQEKSEGLVSHINNQCFQFYINLIDMFPFYEDVMNKKFGNQSLIQFTFFMTAASADLCLLHLSLLPSKQIAKDFMRILGESLNNYNQDILSATKNCNDIVTKEYDMIQKTNNPLDKDNNVLFYGKWLFLNFFDRIPCSDEECKLAFVLGNLLYDWTKTYWCFPSKA